MAGGGEFRDRHKMSARWRNNRIGSVGRMQRRSDAGPRLPARGSSPSDSQVLDGISAFPAHRSDIMHLHRAVLDWIQNALVQRSRFL